MPKSLSVASAALSGLKVGTASAQTITLGGAGTSSLLAESISVYLSTSSAPVANCTSVTYDPGTSVIGFTVTPSASGLNTLYVKIAGIDAPFAYAGASSQGYFVDAAGSTYTMPASFSYSPTTGYVDGIPATMTISTTGAAVSSANVTVYRGASAGLTSLTDLAALTSIGTSSLASNAASVSVTVPTGTWYVYVRVTSPLGVPGPVLGTASTLTSRSYAFPTSFTYAAGSVYVGTATSFAITATGSDPVGGTVVVYASKNQTDPAPVAVCASTTLSASASCTFASTGTWYLFIKVTSPGGQAQGSYVRADATVTVADLPLPTGISSASVSALKVGTSATGQTVTLSGASLGSISMSNIEVYLNTSSAQVTNCTVTAYSAGLVTFTATPTVSGLNVLYVKVTVPGSEQSTTLSYVGSNGQGYFVDAVGSTYTMPTSFTYSPTTLYLVGGTATIKITTTGASATSASIAVLYSATAGLTSVASLTSIGTGSLLSNSATVGVPIPTGTWYLYMRVTSPSGIPGPVLGAAAAATVSTPTLVESGLQIYIDPANARSYPGRDRNRASLNNLVGAVETLVYLGGIGDHEIRIILGRTGLDLPNHFTSVASNNTPLIFPAANVRTISMWVYVDTVWSVTKTLLDATFVGNVAVPGSTLALPSSFGSIWTGSSVYYLNGGPAVAMNSGVFAPFLTASTSWQHLTVVANAVQPATIFTLFGKSNLQQGIAVCFGRILVYDRALSEAENSSNYLLGF
jgi:hypothetical protein